MPHSAIYKLKHHMIDFSIIAQNNELNFNISIIRVGI